MFVVQPNVALPLPAERTPGEIYTPEQLKKIDLYLREKLLKEWKTYAAHYFHAGRWWCRCSAQVFNEVSNGLPQIDFSVRDIDCLIVW